MLLRQTKARWQKPALHPAWVVLLLCTWPAAAEIDPGENQSAPPPLHSDAGRAARWYFQTSIYTVHFRNSDERNNNQWLLNLERQSPTNWLIGGAFFQNSFDQPSQYLYFGKLWRPFDGLPAMHVKLTGGLLHGYKDEHQDSIPFNDYEVAPVILPAIGFSGRRFATELVFYSISGGMWTVGAYFK